MVSNKLENYLALLTIQQAAKRRDTRITGGVFFISFISMIALGMLDRLSERSLYLVVTMVVCYGIAYLSTWVKLKIITGSIELVENLPLIDGE